LSLPAYEGLEGCCSADAADLGYPLGEAYVHLLTLQCHGPGHKLALPGINICALYNTGDAASTYYSCALGQQTILCLKDRSVAAQIPSVLVLSKRDYDRAFCASGACGFSDQHG